MKDACGYLMVALRAQLVGYQHALGWLCVQQVDNLLPTPEPRTSRKKVRNVKKVVDEIGNLGTIGETARRGSAARPVCEIVELSVDWVFAYEVMELDEDG